MMMGQRITGMFACACATPRDRGRRLMPPRISPALSGEADAEVDDAEQGTLDATKPRSRGCLPKCGGGKKKSRSKGLADNDDNESWASDASPVAADATSKPTNKGPGKHAGNTTWPAHVFSQGILNPVHPLRKVRSRACWPCESL